MFSGDLFSRELSSTATSMRGTICYVAPEHGGCGRLMEKADIYSFGVLVLVIVSGRRPLHVLSSPMKLERANLVGWCRQLAAPAMKAPELRPDSGEVVRILKGEMDLPVAPLDSSPSPNSRVSSKRRKAIHDPE
ncbi:uncharacterized protein A4U43_C05F34030 [Asparagus officinalis]|uniref:Protein kinase domain-containing protein n=1 Tax=Asparagus officinalis TaxID=4686 RepID=A0A5P1EWJ2_ASPOF|nr:uncharacterized protein A4U43_C05F34030 [Asparagus officinalis]